MSKPRYLYYYEQCISDTLISSRKVYTVMQLPRLSGLICVGGGTESSNTVSGLGAFELITGQRAKTTRAKKSIASFNLRENDLCGCVVTLRKRQLYTFLDLLQTFIMPKWDWPPVRLEPLRGREKQGHGICKNLCSNSISFGQGHLFSFPQLEPYFPQFEFTKGCNMHIVIDSKRCSADMSKTALWGF